MEKENLKIKIVQGDELVEYDILFTFECEELKKNYIAYTDHSKSETGEENIFIATYNPNSDVTRLGPVTDEEELKMANDVMNSILEG